MQTSQRHIIGKCVWETSMSAQAQSWELQNRISRWSRNVMPREVQRLCETLCPPEQNWNISRLEIDLGEIDINYLEKDLSSKLSTYLREKLYEMLLSPGERGGRIEILHPNVSYLSLFSQYLQTGLWAWNHEVKTRGFHEVVSFLLQENSIALVEEIRQLGSRAYVRRRLTWQLTDKHFFKLVQKLEPTHHDQIISFSRELAVVQAQENVVQCEYARFEKNIRLWILTHLLTERGTLFNMVEFTKSSIRQMAHQYHTTYENLLMLIFQASKKIRQRGSIKPRFIQAVALLTKDLDTAGSPTENHLPTQAQAWKLLLDVFEQESIPNRALLNELLIGFSVHERVELEKLCRRYSHSLIWSELTKRLTEAGFQAMLATLAPHQQASISQQLALIKYWVKRHNKKISKERFRQWTLAYLLKNASFNREDFLTFLLETLRQFSRGLLPKILNSLLYEEVPPQLKSLLFVDEFTRMQVQLEKQYAHIVPPAAVKEKKNSLGNSKNSFPPHALFLLSTEQISIADFSLSWEVWKKHVEKLFTERKENIQIRGKSISFRLLILKALEVSPLQVLQFLQHLSPTSSHRTWFYQQIPFESFLSLLLSANLSKYREGFSAISCWYQLLKELGGSSFILQQEKLFWQHSFPLFFDQAESTSALTKLVDASLKNYASFSSAEAEELYADIQALNTALPQALVEVLSEVHPLLGLLSSGKEVAPVAYLQELAAQDKLQALVYHLFIFQEYPDWFQPREKTSAYEWLKRILEAYPLAFFRVIKLSLIPLAVFLDFCDEVGIVCIFSSLQKLDSAQTHKLNELARFYRACSESSLSKNKVQGRSIQKCLLKLVVNTLTTSNWKWMTATHVWKELLWDICQKERISRQEFYQEFLPLKESFPPSYLLSFQAIHQEKGGSRRDMQKEEVTHASPLKPVFSEVKVSQQSIPVRNAGLVLLNDYMGMLFERLGLVEEGTFLSSDAQLAAVHYLQFLATAQTHTEESFLPLNKLLCGLSPTYPVYDGIQPKEDQISLLQSLIEAVIDHWPEIGSSSIDGFRGNWLVREGMLYQEEDRWKLIVEKRPYDVLIQQSPFSFSIIKHPWMASPLHVSWSH